MKLARRALGLALVTLAADARGASWRVFGSENYAPLLMPQDGAPAGRLAELLAQAGERLGERFELELAAWPRALALAQKGEGGVLGVSHTPERAAWLDYSSPCWVDELRLVVRRGAEFPFRRIEDLHGKRIGIARRATGGAAFDAAAAAGKIQRIDDSGAPARMRALLAGRLDAAVLGAGTLGLTSLLAREPDLQERAGMLGTLPRPLLSDALHLAFPKTLQAQALLRRFDQVLGHLPARQRR